MNAHGSSVVCRVEPHSLPPDHLTEEIVVRVMVQRCDCPSRAEPRVHNRAVVFVNVVAAQAAIVGCGDVGAEFWDLSEQVVLRQVQLWWWW